MSSEKFALMFEYHGVMDVVNEKDGQITVKDVSIMFEAYESDNRLYCRDNASEISIPNVFFKGNNEEDPYVMVLDASQLRWVRVKDGPSFFVYAEDLLKCMDTLRYYGYDVIARRAEDLLKEYRGRRRLSDMG